MVFDNTKIKRLVPGMWQAFPQAGRKKSSRGMIVIQPISERMRDWTT